MHERRRPWRLNHNCKPSCRCNHRLQTHRRYRLDRSRSSSCRRSRSSFRGNRSSLRQSLLHRSCKQLSSWQPVTSSWSQIWSCLNQPNSCHRNRNQHSHTCKIHRHQWRLNHSYKPSCRCSLNFKFDCRCRLDPSRSGNCRRSRSCFWIIAITCFCCVRVEVAGGRVQATRRLCQIAESIVVQVDEAIAVAVITGSANVHEPSASVAAAL